MPVPCCFLAANSIYSAAYMKDVSWIKSDQIVEFLLDDVIDQSLQLFQLLKHEFPLIPVSSNCFHFQPGRGIRLDSLYPASTFVTSLKFGIGFIFLSFDQVCETPETFARSALNSLYGAGIISKPEEVREYLYISFCFKLQRNLLGEIFLCSKLF